MLSLVNQLFKVYFRINKLHLCKPLIRAIDSSPFKEQFALGQRVTYRYYVGRKAMFDSDYKAGKFVMWKLVQKNLIFIYLCEIPSVVSYFSCFPSALEAVILQQVPKMRIWKLLWKTYLVEEPCFLTYHLHAHTRDTYLPFLGVNEQTYQQSLLIGLHPSFTRGETDCSQEEIP